MIKLNLSDGYDLLDYGFSYNICNLYLGYVRTKGYILIQETNNTAWFTPIKSDKDPAYMEKEWGESMGEVKQIYEVLEKIFKGVPNEVFIDAKIDIVGTLIQDLSYKYESYKYISPKAIKNDRIKEFILNPVDQFNYYENTEQKPLNKKEFSYQQQEAIGKIENSLQEAVKLFNDYKAVMGYNKNDNLTQLITDTKFIKLFNTIINDGFGNPLINLRYGKGREKSNQIEAIDYITEEFNIKGVYRNGKEHIYYFNDDLNYFEQLTVENLKNLIISKLGVKLLKTDYNNIYNSLETNNTIHNNLLVFKNMLYDMDYMQELNYPIGNYNRRDYLAPALIGYEDKNHKVQLLNYDNDFDYLTLYDTDPNPNEITFVEKTLRQILIPKDNPNDLKMFHDYLQRLGSCILGVNKYKVITLYYGTGNNGKGILKLLMELVFNKGAYSLTPQTFEQTFGLQSFDNRKVLLLDEIDKDDFKNLKPKIKRITSPEARVEERAMYSTSNVILDNFPMFFIFANVLINLKLDEVALFYRFDFLKLPNFFVTEKELNKHPNNYLIDNDTEAKIKADVDGLSWLITASIQAFRNMQENNSEFILRQTTEQTMDILLDTDYLTKFIRLYTYENEELIPSEFTPVEEIYQRYMQYLEMQGAIISDSEITVKRKIGATIKKLYNIKGSLKDSEIYYKQNNKNASYRIELKSFDEVNKEFKQVYIINEDVSEAEQLAVSYSNDNQIVYSKIQNGVNTINLLSKELPGYDIPMIIRELLNMNLIIKTNELNLNEDGK